MNGYRLAEASAKILMWITVFVINILYFSKITKTFPHWLETMLITVGLSMLVILEWFMPSKLAERKLERGLKYMDRDNDKAVRLLEDYLGSRLLSDKERSNTLRILGVAYHKKGDAPRAIHYLQEALTGFDKDNDQRIEILGALGMIYSEAGEYQKAVEQFNRTFDIIFSLSRAHIDKAALLLAVNSYIMAGKKEEAAVIYDRLLMIRGFKRDKRVEELLGI